MKISLLVLVYEAEEFIERCARSLFGQTYRDIEYIFVNDGTEDSSMELLQSAVEQFPGREKQVRIINNDRNRGIAFSRNEAMYAARGEYLLFVDSDDYLDLRAVELLAAEAAETRGDMIVYDSVTVYDGFEKVNKEVISSVKEEYVKQIMFREVRGAMWAKMIRREIIVSNNLRFVEGMDYGEDIYLSPIIACYCDKIVKLDIPLYYYVRYNTSSVSYTISRKKIDNLVIGAELLEDFFSSVPDSQIYLPMVEGMKIRNKVAILQAGDRSTWEYSAGLYPELDSNERGLKWDQRLVLWFARRRMWGAMRAYQCAAKVIMKVKSV